MQDKSNEKEVFPSPTIEKIQKESEVDQGHNKKDRWLVYIALIAVGIFTGREYLKPPAVAPRPVLLNSQPQTLNPTLQRPDYQKIFNDKNQRALQVFDIKVKGILDQMSTSLGDVNDKFAKEISTFNGCVYLIYLLAYDKVYSSQPGEASKYMDGKLESIITPRSRKYLDELKNCLVRLELDLMENLVYYATQVGGDNPAGEGKEKIFELSVQSKHDFDTAMKRLGLNGVTSIPFATIDAVFLIKTQAFKILIQKLKQIALRIFARPIATSVGSVVIASSDGPLPFGDVIAIGGFIWTAYDIYLGRVEFENDIKQSMANLKIEVVEDQRKRVIEIANQILKVAENMSDDVRKGSPNPVVGNRTWGG